RPGQARAQPVWRADAQRLHCHIQPLTPADSAVGHVSTENDDSGCYGSTHPERMRPVDRNPLVSEGYQGDLSCMYDTHLLNTHQGGRKNACSGCVSIFALEELLARMLRSMSGSRSSN